MTRTILDLTTRRISPLWLAAALAVFPRLAVAQALGQQTFPSASAASQALAYAVQGDNRDALAGILGADTDLIASGDDSRDQIDRRLFVEKYQQMHRLTREADGAVILFIGAENWPFPVPLASKGGRWYFDVDAGTEEVLVRRIGENELEAIAMSEDLATHTHTPGLVSATPANGYYYRVLDTKGTVLAYPAAYRSSGVMTFLVTPAGVVYEKDLGAQTEDIAASLHSSDRREAWHRVSDAG
jgi:hypothetical protein